MTTLAKLIRRRKVIFWGSEHMIARRLLTPVLGDGKLVIFLTPLATRPHSYVIRIDSKTDLDSDDFIDTTLEEIYDNLEDDFGKSVDEYEHNNGRTYVKNNGWPTLDDSCGCCWGELARLTKPDTRSEKQVRKEISKASQ